MKNQGLKHRLSTFNVTLFGWFTALWTVLGVALFIFIYFLQKERDRVQATIYGESIVSSIVMELGRCYNTTELMNDLYSVNAEGFLRDFDELCAELQIDNLAIGSMYWAPDGIITHSYPERVTEATTNYNMLLDPVQGPKSQQALISRQATIAGPHNLVEGGKGFIIRNPVFDDEGLFIGFAVMVIDDELFMAQINANLKEETRNYRFAVWKDPDPNAIYDEGGYIFTSDGPIEERLITLPFNAPNDHWYLTLEPKAGWSPWFNLRLHLTVLLGLWLIMVALTYILLRNRQMLHARDAALAASSAKTSFLFAMSHDIRTPMNAIIGFSKLMEQHQDDPKRWKDYLQKINDSSQVMLSIINNVLEMARIESGTMELNETVTDVDTFMEKAYAVFEDQMAQKCITFSYKADIEHRYVWADETKMHEVMLNILSNAYKYTNPGGSVMILVKELPSDREGEVYYQTKFTDTGIGMSADFLPHIFDEFSREHTSTENKIAGTGLGMPIVKRLVDLMHGTIEVESQQGVGTTFTITLPHRIATSPVVIEPEKQQEEPTSLVGKRLLLAEDNELNAEIAIELLSDLGLNVEHAEDGVRALEMVEQAAAGYYYAVLMDIQMPRMNGYEAARAIRSLSDPLKAQTPIFAMTANAFEEDRQNAHDAGMNGHLVKPIEIEAIVEALSKLG